MKWDKFQHEESIQDQAVLNLVLVYKESLNSAEEP